MSTLFAIEASTFVAIGALRVKMGNTFTASGSERGKCQRGAASTAKFTMTRVMPFPIE